MRHYTPVTTMAAALALALALLVVVLLPADSPVHAADPTFVSGAGTRTVPENTPPGVNIGAPISATDADEDDLEFGNTLTYSLGGIDADKFDIDPSTGQLITKALLDAEATGSTSVDYTVTVTVDDGETRETPLTPQTVTITVTDVDEEPAAPLPPTVVSGPDNTGTTPDDESTTSLKVVWHLPVNTGEPTPTGYAVEYKKSTETSFDFTNVAHSGADRFATITVLEPDTSYDVRVRATNGEGTGPWSFVGTGSTNKAGNSRPQSNDTTPATRRVDENTSAGENIGSPVSATDLDTTTLTYSLGGPDANLFNFNTRSGQILTKAPLNHEDPRCYDDSDTNNTTCRYYVTVTVVDGAGGSDATGVTIEVEDRVEPASAPARPTVRAKEDSSTSLVVSWNPPTNTGPDIVSYDVQYRAGSDPFSDDHCRNVDTDDNCLGITGTTSTTIIGLEKPTNPSKLDPVRYEVRVRANNGERASAWSASGMGDTNKANHQPIFNARTGATSERNSDFTIPLTIDENPRSGQSLGRVFADDQDNDRLTYKLQPSEDTDAARAEVAKFTINETTGEIRTKAGATYDYEVVDTGTCGTLTEQEVGSDRCYTIKVEVRDGLNDDRVEVEETESDDSVTVRIGVRDRDEPPAVPTVTVTSPTDNTTLVVIWEAKNTGPTPITYDVQYRKGGGTFSDENCTPAGTDNCNGIADTNTTTISGLESDTQYSVQVRAKNDEGTSTWSRLVTLKTNKSTNIDLPAFDEGDAIARSVDEKSSSNNVGNPVNAQDGTSNSLTYRLEGPDAAMFTIVSSSGQIRTRSALNHEDEKCGYVAPTNPTDTTTCAYTVWVKVEDGDGSSANTVVTITVVDVNEAPSAPSAPRVTATKDSGWSLDVTWNAPRDTGKPPITDYDIQYRKFKSGTPKDTWELWPHGTADDAAADNTDTSAKITRRLPADTADPLEPRTQYEVRVQAKNHEGASDWLLSGVGRGTTGQSNSRPSFDRDDAVIELSVDENTRSGQNVGSAISATDADSNGLIYTLEGPGKDSFTIASNSGQIRTRAALNYEERNSYSVTVKVDDRQNKANSMAAKSVTITVDDVREPPPPPAAPTVAGIPGSTSSVRVTWDEPANTGPAIIDYDVHYREVGQGPGRWDHFGVDRSTIITGLKAGTRYEVQVRAISPEATGDWSRWGAGMPNPDVANRNPTFSGGARTLSVAENTLPNTDVGDPIAATDRDGDTLTYSLEGTDRDSFDILSTSDGGQIRTSTELNFEEKASYTVTVRVTDGRGGTDAVNVTIRVTDVDGEAPDTPFAPTVTAISSTRLQVTWEAPENTGPPITDYDYRYREPTASWNEVTNTTITDTTVTIEGLAASTSYDVEVRATNAEGTSEWSNPGIGSTNAPGANNPPVFAEGTSATRTVSATSPAGTLIGEPVAATDADAGDTLEYSLGGRDAALFDIDRTTGQLSTKSGITLIVGTTYTVTVEADDGTDITNIAVSIEATAAPPNNLPVFTDAPSATRSVVEGTASGRNVGAPVSATDADAGDTITYSLEGTDASSFSIVATSGQIQTSAALNASTKSTYSVTVKATDSKGGSATIPVTITVIPNNLPVFSGGPRSFTVRDNAAAGTPIGSPVRAIDADGDTLTYTLDAGTDASSFDIRSTTAGGQIVTRSGVTLTAGRAYSVTMRATDSGGGSATLGVTITVIKGTFGCATNGAVSDASNTGLVSDCEALLRARNQLEGSARLNWSEFSPITNWQGIFLGGSPTRVTVVALPRQNLNGTVPADLGDLPMLTQLNLHSNDLSGSIPPELNRLSRLQRLFLHNNRLSGTIPNLGNLRNLERLWLSGSNMNLSGGVPAWLNSMNRLEQLSLWGNNLGGSIPRLTGMASLRLLKLQSNNLTGSVPAWFGDMNGPAILYLHDNDLTGSIPANLGRNTGVVRLWLDRNDLTGSIPRELGNMSSLRTLNLHGNQLTGSIPPELGNLSRLQHIGFHNNRRVNDSGTVVNSGLTGSIPSQLGNLSSLTRLALSNNSLTGPIPSELGNLGSLGLLWLSQNQLSGAIPSQLGNLGNTLTDIKLAGNSFDANTCVPRALANVAKNDYSAAGLSICP